MSVAAAIVNVPDDGVGGGPNTSFSMYTYPVPEEAPGMFI